MQYFASLPKIVYTDKNRVSRVFTNLLTRASMVPSLMDNPLVFYTYDIQDEDTPEIVAHKYYGDVYRYWIVLYCNQITDPQWDWPINNRVFDSYVADKYRTQAATALSLNVSTITDAQVIAYTSSLPYNYKKIITQYEASTQTTTTNEVVIDWETYNSLVNTTKNYSLPTGQVTVSITGTAMSVYDYEMEVNESKRKIKILNKTYADQLESEFKKLMSV